MKRLHRHTWPILSLILLTLVANPAWAQEDGGGRSILSNGAGNRALSLGGAYAAVGDDASAVFWNPGCLGLVQRREIQTSHTNLMGLGFSEQYASIVLPSWQWGVGSLSIRRFGVDGIEGRDNRNILTNPNLSNNEFELTLGYGRQIGSAWNLGGAVKLRSQSLAGYSDTGQGIDLGVHVHPLVALGMDHNGARDLSLGVAVRNAVQPSLRLNEVPVKDPAGIRVGSAYRMHFAREGEILLALDVEKTRDMDLHLHAGLEVSIVPALAVRAGINQNRFVAGTGFGWRDIGIDYQFEDHSSGYFHRFGVSMKFGNSRDESQRLAIDNQEKEFQTRLASVFTGQQRERKLELLDNAQAALQAREIDEALSHLAMIKVIDPEATELPGLEAQALVIQATEQEKAGDYLTALVTVRKALELDPNNTTAKSLLERVRKASDQQARRSVEIREILDAALDAFAAGNLEEARSGFKKVLTLTPDDKEAQAMLTRTDLATRNQASNHLAQARILITAGQFDEAAGELAAALALDPQVPGYDEVSRYLEDQMVPDIIETSLALPSPAIEIAPEPGLSEKQRQEMSGFYQRGKTAMEAGEDDQAIHFWELVWSMDPDFQSVSKYLSQIYLDRGMQAFVVGDLSVALVNWEAAVRVDPADPKALGYLQRAREQAENMKKMDYQEM